jgi:hypothetical protein
VFARVPSTARAKSSFSAMSGLASWKAPSSPSASIRNREWKPAQLAAGIEPLRRTYDLGHAFATFALRAGISTFDLSCYIAPA